MNNVHRMLLHRSRKHRALTWASESESNSSALGLEMRATCVSVDCCQRKMALISISSVAFYRSLTVRRCNKFVNNSIITYNQPIFLEHIEVCSLIDLFLFSSRLTKHQMDFLICDSIKKKSANNLICYNNNK